MSASKLVLSPQNSDYRPNDAETLVLPLVDIGFIGDRFASDGPGERYLVGERFLQLVTFLGCSPYIAMEPPQPGALDFCHIAIELRDEVAALLCGRNTTPPRCPHCRHRWGDWRESVDQWVLLPQDAVVCKGCGQPTAPSRLDWRNSAGAGRVFVAIHSVFPGEAVPVDELMNTLANASGTPWKHFYVQD